MFWEQGLGGWLRLWFDCLGGEGGVEFLGGLCGYGGSSISASNAIYKKINISNLFLFVQAIQKLLSYSPVFIHSRDLRLVFQVQRHSPSFLAHSPRYRNATNQ